MRAFSKRVLCALLAALMLSVCSISVGAVNEYMQNPRWRPVTASEATQMLESGETFVLFCYRESCGNCRNVGAKVVTEWMDTYGKEIFGADVDAKDGLPSWVKAAMGKKRATLPFVAYVRDGAVKAFSKETDLASYMALLNDEFFMLYPELTRAELRIETMPDKTVYQTDEPLDTRGMTLRAIYPDGSSETVTQGYVCEGFSSAQPGHKSVQVTYNGLSATITLAVNTPDGNPAIWIEQPARTKLRFGESATLYVDYCNLPQDTVIEWSCLVKSLYGDRNLSGRGKAFSITSKGYSQKVKLTVRACAPDGKPILNNDGAAVKTQHEIRFQNNIFFRLEYYFRDVLGWF